MNRGFSVAVVVVWGSLLVAGAGCAGARQEAPPSTGTASTTNGAPAANSAPAPAEPPAPTGGSDQLLESTEERDLARSAALFETNCTECHLASGTGNPHHRKDRIPNFTNAAWQKRESEAALIEAVTNGHGRKMPAFKDKLSAEEIRLVVRYVRGFPERASATAPDATQKATPRPKGGGHAGH